MKELMIHVLGYVIIFLWIYRYFNSTRSKEYFGELKDQWRRHWRQEFWNMTKASLIIFGIVEAVYWFLQLPILFIGCMVLIGTEIWLIRLLHKKYSPETYRTFLEIWRS